MRVVGDGMTHSNIPLLVMNSQKIWLKTIHHDEVKEKKFAYKVT